jgi:hypothetical protein
MVTKVLFLVRLFGSPRRGGGNVSQEGKLVVMVDFPLVGGDRAESLDARTAACVRKRVPDDAKQVQDFFKFDIHM